jgi:hypothetical protein
MDDSLSPPRPTGFFSKAIFDEIPMRFSEICHMESFQPLVAQDARVEISSSWPEDPTFYARHTKLQVLNFLAGVPIGPRFESITTTIRNSASDEHQSHDPAFLTTPSRIMRNNESTRDERCVA